MSVQKIDNNLFSKIRNQTNQICHTLEVEDHVVQPSEEVSPPKWHLSHTSWFFEKFILQPYCANYPTFDEHFDQLFNSYYKSCGEHWLQQDRGILSRPTVKKVYEYRDHIDKHMGELFNSSIIENSEVKTLIEVGLHHEQQHQELLYMDIKYILSVNKGFPKYQPSSLNSLNTTSKSWFNVEGGLYTIGASNGEFSFDNEQPQHKFYQHPCQIGDQLVTNQDYLEFIQDGAYQNPLLWLSDGWNWLQQSKHQAPIYWHLIDNQWYEFTLHGLLPLENSIPISHLNFYEANAFAKWSGARLPTEQELEIYFQSTLNESQGIPVEAFHPVSNQTKDRQLWLWTQSAYTPYPGYQSFHGDLAEYNGKFMCMQQVLRGGCFATPINHYRNTYRNFYYPQQSWMFSGICLAKDLL